MITDLKTILHCSLLVRYNTARCGKLDQNIDGLVDDASFAVLLPVLLLAATAVPRLWMSLSLSTSFSDPFHNNTDLFFPTCSLHSSGFSHRTGNLQVFPYDILWGHPPALCNVVVGSLLNLPLLHTCCLFSPPPTPPLWICSAALCWTLLVWILLCSLCGRSQRFWKPFQTPYLSMWFSFQAGFVGRLCQCSEPKL